MRHALWTILLLATGGLSARECICYPPAYYDLECDCGFFASVDFLYWYARETNLSYGLKTTTKPINSTESAVFADKVLYNDVSWDPGFRIGVGWHPGCDGWDLYLHWTYYHNRETDSDRRDEEFGILDPWVNSAVFPIPYFQETRATWRLNFNSIDLELGRKYWPGRCFTLRPYMALRGAWTKTDFTVRSTSTVGTAKDAFTSRFWGVGFLGGLQPSWYFTKCFSLFGNLDFALIWGEFDGSKKETYPNLSNRVENCFSKMQAIFDLAIGLRWEDTWCCKRYRTSFDVGWEHHDWLDLNQRYKYLGQQTVGNVSYFTSFQSVVGDLNLGGLVIRARFDF